MLPIARFGQNQSTENKGLSTQLRPDDASFRVQTMVQVTNFSELFLSERMLKLFVGVLQKVREQCAARRDLPKS